MKLDESDGRFDDERFQSSRSMCCTILAIGIPFPISHYLTGVVFNPLFHASIAFLILWLRFCFCSISTLLAIPEIELLGHLILFERSIVLYRIEEGNWHRHN